MAWTEEQQAAIDARGASLVISAAAGSGKTSVLVTRITEMLADASKAYPAEKNVIVTFTNDAAAEVRTRLNTALSERIGAEPENEWLSRQYTLLQSMKVSTIHSFCFDFLREHSALLPISAGFRIMDSTEETVLRNEAAKQTVSAFCEQSSQDDNIKQAMNLLYDAFCDNSDTALESMILALYHLEEDAPFGEYLLRDAAAQCSGDGMKNAAKTEISAVLDDVLMLYAKAMETVRPVGTPKQIAGISDELSQADALKAALDAEDFPLLGGLLGAMIFGKLILTSKKHPEALAAVKALRNHARELLKELKIWSVPLKYAPEDLPRHAELLQAADLLVTDFSARLRDMKQDRDAIGFSDAIAMTLSLVAKRETDGTITKTPLAEEAAAQYACIMIDEFQDADNQQDLIFRMLSHGGNAQKYGDNLFVVGDSKQCIYRFRNANPQNFYRALCESAPYRSTALTENTCIHLNRNFRSAEEVIAAVNLVFSRLMTPEVGEIQYDDTQALRQGAVFPPADRPIEFLLLDNAAIPAAEEPRAIASVVAKHLADGTPVRQKDGSLRPCMPSDFLILMRNSTRMQAYAAALTERGIPVCPIEESSYLASPEITLLLDILRAVDNPLLDVPVCAAMLSPLHSFTLDELTAVCLFRRKSAVYQSVRAIVNANEHGEPVDLPEETVRKCTAFYQFMDNMRLASAMETPEQLIRRIYDHTDFLGMMQMMPNGAQRKANLRALISYARSCEETGNGGLSGFLRLIDRLIARKVKLNGGGVPAGSDNVVSMKTIHKSKGLEAPFVILAESHTAFRSDENTSDLLFHAECGIGFRLRSHAELTYDSTLPYLTAAARINRESLSEELRLLYVALTRAKEYLILPIRFGGKTLTERLTDFAAEQTVCGYTDCLTRYGNCMRDWLLMIFMRNISCENLRRILDIPCGTDSTQPAIPVSVQLYQPEKPSESGEEDGAEPTADEAMTAALQAQCAWEYREKAAGLTAKYGVSELSKQEDFSVPLRRPRFVCERKSLTGAERGTALHTFLQYADFDAAAKNTENEINRLQALGRLSPKQAETVARSKIAGFFTSGLFRRIQAAKEIWRERKFTVRLSDLRLTGALAELSEQYAGTDGMLVGIMDLVLVEEDGLVLIDYKTDSVRSMGILLERYTTQIQLYAAALRLITEMPVKACLIYSIKLNRTVSVDAGK